ncbi:MAG: T9SS type A sorting domain-containing protein [Bacteroidales bacterium]|nr:T9SS type A sorting domain-containing protein [Bacteroidales bacterium]
MKHVFSTQCHRLIFLLSVVLIAQTSYAQLITVEADPAQGFAVKVNGNLDARYTYLMHSVVPANFSDIVFDSDGKPTMDELYVFLTLPPEAEPLLQMKGEVYLRCLKNNSAYTAVDNAPAGNKNFVFKNCNGKHLYFTGECRSAYPGDPAAKSAGVFVLQGGTGEKVDIYLHDFSITVQDKQVGSAQFNDLFSAYDPGCMASAFAIESDNEDTNRPFTANFHICGENTITGGNRSIFTAPEDDAIAQVLANILTITNSPIAICPLAKTLDEVSNKTAKLVFDDIVPVRGDSTRVNGKLNLPLEGSYSTPAIDLGNANGFCEFNGGQYRFATPASNSMFYVCSMAISYKMLTISGTTRYGIGSSVGSPNVNENKVRISFNDGTFSTYSAEAYKDDNIDVVARGWYADYTDLRLSYESRINGGTFSNCRVYRCDASAERGASPIDSNHESLCYKELVVPAPAEPNGTMSAAQVAADSYLNAAANYGSQSLTPVKENEQYKLNVYLPLADCDEDVSSKEYIHNWVTVIPKMGANGVLTMGGDVEVSALETDGRTKRKNAYLFYARLNDYTKKYAYVDFGPLRATVQQAIKLGGGPEYTSVTNADAYSIAHGLYTMLSFNTNQWYTLTMPYDVANIYIIETTETQKGADETLGDFLKRQGEADGALASTIITSLCPDIFSGKGSGVYMNLIDIATKQLNRTPIQLFPYSPDHGYGADKAHFYLYEQKPAGYDEFSPTQPYWEFSADADDYGKMWTRVTPESFAPADGVHDYIDQEGNPVPAGNIWMKKGHVYSLFLPDSESSRYWDGKYLIFEGYGPQDILGTDAHMPDNEGYWPQEYVDDDKAFIQGNATFANQIVSEQVFIPTVDTQRNYEFTRVDADTEIKPCEVMMVLSPNNTNAHQYIKRGGPVAQINESSQAVADDNLPKVSDVALVAKASDGIVLYSYAAQQVNIYTLDGRLLYSDTLSDGSVVRVPAASGVYLVQGQEQTYKLIVP